MAQMTALSAVLCRQASLPDGSFVTCRQVSGRDTRRHAYDESAGFQV